MLAGYDWILICKCQLCGETFECVYQHRADSPVDALADAKSRSTWAHHKCRDGVIGIGLAIGLKLQ
jgi:hypothetical protein